MRMSVRLPRSLPRRRLAADSGDRGSMSVELVVIAPALVLMLLLIGAGGRWVESHGALGGAARDAARAASVGRTPEDADSLAQQAAQADLATSGWCDGGTVSVGVNGFPATATIAQGTDVTVTVSCNVNMAPFTLLGFQAATPVTARAVAPLDPFMCRGVNCQ
jgi:Flp pilus assembly protein TadG